MNNVIEALARSRKLESGKPVKTIHPVYNRTKPAPKKIRPQIDKKLVWKLFRKHKPPAFV